MGKGIGGVAPQEALEQLTNQTDSLPPISKEEFQQRIVKAQALMSEANIDAIYLNAGTNLYYFTGTQWYASERLVGAILTAKGELTYIAPHFEVDTLSQYMQIEAPILSWHEHESPYLLVEKALEKHGLLDSTLGIDETAQFFISNGIKLACPSAKLVDAKPVTAGCRAAKSDAEIAILQRAKDITLVVQQAAASILYEGITTKEVEQFINQAHIKMGAASGSYFCIVLFGEDSAYPHGVKAPKALAKNDVVLIDTGCELFGYHSDITRTYVFGEASERQRKMWNIEKAAQIAAFNAAQIGVPCGDVDTAARQLLEENGLGPGYQTPGCPHRTGHGIGLDIHEWPYLVSNDRTPLEKGMCFSNEPMLVLPQEFGIRLEDHFYMTDTGPCWFTEPSYSIDDPFGIEANS